MCPPTVQDCVMQKSSSALSLPETCLIIVSANGTFKVWYIFDLLFELKKSSLWVKLEKLRCQSAAFESAGQHSQPHINFLPFNKLAIHLTTLQLSTFTHLRCIMFNMYQISFKHYRKELTKVSRFFRGRYLGNKKSYWIS